MNYFADLSNVFRMLKVWGVVVALWPLNSASRFKFYDLLWLIYIVNGVTVWVAIFRGIQCCFTRLEGVMESVVEGIYIFESLFCVVYCRIMAKDLQHLLSEIEDFAKVAKPHEANLKRRYTQRIKMIYTIWPSVILLGSVLFMLMPIASERIVPLNTVYPFIPLDTRWGVYVVYALNGFTVVQASTPIFMDLVVLTVIWHATYKFGLTIFVMNIERKTLRKSMIIYQNGIRYAEILNYTVRPILIKSVSAVSVYMITCSILLLKKIPYIELSVFFIISSFSFVRLFMCCWSAQIMTETAFNVSWTAYDLPWLDESTSTRITILMIIQRCQKLVLIHANGLLKPLTLETCRSVMYTTFSFFLTLKAILHV